MELKSRYITKEDFLLFSGEELAGSLVDGDNPSNKVDAFIFRTEVRLRDYIDATFYKNVDMMYPEFTDYQKEHYKLALLEQCLYVYKNGDIGVDSGYEQEQGQVVSRKQIEEMTIAPNAIRELKLCGLWNTHINPHRGDGIGWIR